ncbi:MAG TPA: ABC transporter permease [Candidatus Deferrimicrobiaceae bacterium]|nr:ABC transporter permease [Candidatus Deferrimicrobiaceae bacterium]
MSGRPSRDDRLVANTWLVARREFGERVRSRIFFASTVFLAVLAILVALMPVLIRLADRGTTTTVAIVAADDALAERTALTMAGILGQPSAAGERPQCTFERASPDEDVALAVSDGRYAGALIVGRRDSGGLEFRFLTGEAIGADRAQLVQVGALAVAILEYTFENRGSDGTPFVAPEVDIAAVAGPSAGGRPIAASEYAGRRIVGVVFVILIFITLVIYGMWVAAGVVAEKSSRVMELLTSAATPAQLVLGKVIGIGLAGLVQYVAVLVPALLALFLEDRIATAVLGPSAGIGVSLGILTPGLLLAYAGFWALGFVLYALIYAAAGSLVSRAEDLQVIALPLSIIAIGGYLQAVMALTGGINPLLRMASYVPFWSPFIMLTRLTVGRAEPWEVGLAFALLVLAIAIVGILAVRVYAAGVLLYGQRPGLRAISAAILRPPA